jgi:hypothetical protein
MECAATSPTLFTVYLIPILRRFRLIGCTRQAALLSALFIYTPHVIGGTDKNKQLTIVKQTQIGINRNELFALLNIGGPQNFQKPVASLS